jgi:hypothetical protein
VGLCAVATAIVVGGLTWHLWWPGWPAVAVWGRTRWWQVAAFLMALTGGVLVLKSIRSSPTPDNASPVVWERSPGALGLIALTTPTVMSLPPHILSAPERPSHRWNLAAITSAVTAFTALAALIFTAQSLIATRDQLNVSEQGQLPTGTLRR